MHTRGLAALPAGDERGAAGPGVTAVGGAVTMDVECCPVVGKEVDRVAVGERRGVEVIDIHGGERGNAPDCTLNVKRSDADLVDAIDRVGAGDQQFVFSTVCPLPEVGDGHPGGAVVGRFIQVRPADSGRGRGHGTVEVPAEFATIEIRPLGCEAKGIGAPGGGPGGSQ